MAPLGLALPKRYRPKGYQKDTCVDEYSLHLLDGQHIWDITKLGSEAFLIRGDGAGWQCSWGPEAVTSPSRFSWIDFAERAQRDSVEVQYHLMLMLDDEAKAHSIFPPQKLVEAYQADSRWVLGWYRHESSDSQHRQPGLYWFHRPSDPQDVPMLEQQPSVCSLQLMLLFRRPWKLGHKRAEGRDNRYKPPSQFRDGSRVQVNPSGPTEQTPEVCFSRSMDSSAPRLLHVLIVSLRTQFM